MPNEALDWLLSCKLSSEDGLVQRSLDHLFVQEDSNAHITEWVREGACAALSIDAWCANTTTASVCHPFGDIHLQETGLEKEKEAASALLLKAKAAEATLKEGERKAEASRLVVIVVCCQVKSTKFRWKHVLVSLFSR